MGKVISIYMYVALMPLMLVSHIQQYHYLAWCTCNSHMFKGQINESKIVFSDCKLPLDAPALLLKIETMRGCMRLLARMHGRT